MKSLARQLGAFFIDTLQTIVLAAAIFMLIYLFLVQPYQVKGNSMDPNFLNGERLLANKIIYHFSKPRRGDVIVFHAPPDHNKDFIKRIVALPGESVLLKDGRIYINQQLLEEFYLPNSVKTQPATFLLEDKEITLGPDEYLVLGDNRNHSSDSRSWGPVKRKDIIGRAWFIYWPPEKAGVIPDVTYAGF